MEAHQQNSVTISGMSKNNKRNRRCPCTSHDILFISCNCGSLGAMRKQQQQLLQQTRRWSTLFIITILSLISQTVSITITEQEILKELYDSTNGDNWKIKTNWKSESVGICDWHGILCDPTTQQVIEIDLSHNNLNGMIPSSIWKLPNLYQVTLRNNLITSLSLQGLLTTDPTNDPRSPLKTLIVSDNHLASLNGIGNAAQTLKQINVNKNQIDRTVLEELCYCINLEIIYVAFNRIPGTIPTMIGQLTKLTELYGFDNRLSGTIPTELGLLVSLQVLGLGNNLITGTLPTQLEQMVNLKDLSIHHIMNDAASSPPFDGYETTTSNRRGLFGPLLTFGDMPYLSLLFLDGNSFTGTIPQDFLRHNTFTETSISVGLTYNQLTGAIPKSLERFEALSIDLAGNNITEIPNELCHKGGWMGGLVEQFQCDAILCAPGTYNELGRAFDSQNPCIPCDSTNTTNQMGATTCDGLPSSSAESGSDSQDPLVILANFHTAMAGQKWTIRDGWTTLDPLIAGTSTLDEIMQLNITICDGWYGILCDSDDQITDISLGKNELYGVVPDFIFGIPTLRAFDISNNNVQMTNLKGASRARGLTSLILSNVKVQSIEGIGAMTNLRQLLLDGLEIKTPLSKELFKLTNLMTLHLQHGQFTGVMPSEIGSLTNLQDLNIYGNNLRGQIPLEIGTLTRLRSLDLSENQFTGTIPPQISTLVDLEIFAIHQREGVSNIGGPLPAFDDFPRLKEVDLEYNALTGTIPNNFLARIADKSNEIRISLGYNRLQGAIPGSLNAFDKLILNLEGNQITSIPSPLCAKSNWMQGEVGKISNTTEKCNAILCPPGFWNEYGKESEGAPCIACDSDLSSSQGNEWEFWFGRVSCGDITPSREKEILDIFFSATGGRYWKVPHGNWLRPGVPICQREGVSCGNSQANTGVLELRMNGFGLRGTIPSEIWELTNARQLAFTKNEVELSFTGIEKAEALVVLKLSSCHVRTLDGLGKVSNKLRELHLAGNQFSGTIPAEMFELNQVQLLFLNGNNFSGKIPTQLAKLTSLTRLELFDNRFTGPLPSEIALISDLTTLELQLNELSGTIPTELQTLEKLSRLDISWQGGRKFEGAFPPFDRSPSLVYIDASGNRFSGTLPANLLAMIDSSQEVNVILQGNSFEGAIPVEWSRFESLNVELGGNRLTALPESLCQLNNWQKGLVGLFNTCDAILCPPGTQSATGRQTEVTETCTPCTAGVTSAPYYGTLACLDPRLVAEKRILSDFYENTNGTNWLIQTNWLSDESVCSWYGIFCDANNHVKEIKLDTNMIVSSPASKDAISAILTLPELTLLDLKGNSLEFNFAKIPEATRLEYLGLSGTGMKSIVGISRAKSLKALYATNNEIRSIPEEVFSMTNLESLFLSYNSITGTLSTHLARMSSLKELYMFGNRLTGNIPSQIGQLSSLRDIVLARNYLSGTLPDSLSFMPMLKQLLVYDQQGVESLGGPLPSLSRSPNLWNFDASDNHLKGPIPDNFMMGSSSTGSSISVNLRNNDITGTLPLELKRFGMLDINLADNKILNIPSELCTLGGWMQGKVKVVGNCSAILCPKGFFNQFGHESPGIPCLPCDLLINDPYLGHTHCENFTSERDTLNKIFMDTGGEFWANSTNWKSEAPICSWQGVLCENGNVQDAEGITSLRLDNNGLSGTLPTEVWTLPTLRYLSLQKNPNLVINLNGLVHAATTLEVLSLSETGLRSLKGISAASSLKELHVTGNRIKGTFPDELLALSQSLESLHIGDNLFYGSLPTKLGKMTKLQELYAFQNDFLSTIPSELGRLEYLRVLVLAENMLYGQIPDELSEMPSLETLAFFRREKSGPRLTGSLPSFHKLPQLKEFYLQGNSIQGSIPDNFLSSSRSLQVARLGFNLLTGKVPELLGVLAKLSLEFEGNLITGLPESFCENKEWMDGTVGVYGCDAILCPPGTANPLGRATADAVECTECSKVLAPKFYGSTSCFGPSSEREILLKLFSTLDGKAWYRNDFWGSNADICDWYGIGCIGGHVAVINLSANNLRGLPAPEIFLLPELRVLWLYSNPMEFNFENIMNAKKLEDLRLDATMLHSLRGIGAATSLVSFDASFTALHGSLPEQEILALTNLRTLMLNNNGLTGTLPKSFASLKYLMSLRIDSNHLSGKLPSFDDMPFLEYIDLSDNRLEGPIPRTVFHSLDALASPTLRLLRNQLTGVVPQEFDRFDEMTIYLAGNQILGLPVVLCDNANWNDGDVGNFGCDAIMCKPGSSNSYGRRTPDSQCEPCFSASYYGDISCPGDSSAMTRSKAPLLFTAVILAALYQCW